MSICNLSSCNSISLHRYKNSEKIYLRLTIVASYSANSMDKSCFEFPSMILPIKYKHNDYHLRHPLLHVNVFSKKEIKMRFERWRRGDFSICAKIFYEFCSCNSSIDTRVMKRLTFQHAIMLSR